MALKEWWLAKPKWIWVVLIATFAGIITSFIDFSNLLFNLYPFDWHIFITGSKKFLLNFINVIIILGGIRFVIMKKWNYNQKGSVIAGILFISFFIHIYYLYGVSCPAQIIMLGGGDTGPLCFDDNWIQNWIVSLILFTITISFGLFIGWVISKIKSK